MKNVNITCENTKNPYFWQFLIKMFHVEHFILK